MWKKVWESFCDFCDSCWDTVVKGFKTVVAFVEALYDSIFDFFSYLFDEIGDLIGKMKKGIMKLFCIKPDVIIKNPPVGFNAKDVETFEGLLRKISGGMLEENPTLIFSLDANGKVDGARQYTADGAKGYMGQINQALNKTGTLNIEIA